jgi:hypothetical protein
LSGWNLETVDRRRYRDPEKLNVEKTRSDLGMLKMEVLELKWWLKALSVIVRAQGESVGNKTPWKTSNPKAIQLK